MRTPFVINPHRDRNVSYHRTRYPVPHVPLHGEPHKSCAKCRRLKPLTEFGPALTWDGLSIHCNDCHVQASGRPKEAAK